MSNPSRVGSEASQTFAELESPARRLFVKGVAGLGLRGAAGDDHCFTLRRRMLDTHIKAASPDGVAQVVSRFFCTFLQHCSQEGC
jgi:hypothetical protein